MARMARTRTDYQSGNGGMPSVKVGSMSHVVAQKVSTSDGLNPFAGDLTAAFGNFFGKVQNTLEQNQASQFAIQKVEAQRSANLAANEGKAAASMAVIGGATVADTSLAALDPEKNPNADRRSFVDAYRDTFGSNLGHKLFGDFVTSQADQNPANYEANAQAFYDAQIGKGTGDLRVDTSMQSSWANNYETGRINAKVETIKNAKSATLTAIKDDTLNRVGASEFGIQDMDAITAGVTSIWPGSSLGENSARALGLARDAAVAKGPAATQRFLAMMDKPRYDATGNEALPGSSLAEKFPSAVEEIRRTTWDKLQANVTMSGYEAVTSAGARLAALDTDVTDEFDRFNAVASFLTSDLPTLANTPGMPFAQLTALRAEAVKKLTALGEYKLGMNTLKGFGINGERPAHMDADYVKKHIGEFMGRYADVLGGPTPGSGETDAQLAARAGAFLKRTTDQFGDAILTDEVKAVVFAPLLSDDPRAQLRGRDMLMSLDPTGARGRAIVASNPRAAAAFDALMNNNGSVPAMVAANSPQMVASREVIAKAGGVNSYLYPDGMFGSKSKEARQKAFNEDFMGSKMGEAFEEAMGIDGSFFNPMSWGTQDMSPELQLQVDGHVKESVAHLLANGGSEESLDMDAIRKDVARKMAPNVVSINGKLTTLTTYNGKNQSEGVAGPDGKTPPTPIGNNVYNQNTGIYENTAKTLMEDSKAIADGMVGLELGTGMTVEKNADLMGQNLFGVMHNGLPLTLGLNENFKVNKQFKTDGQEIGWAAKWWAGEETIQFTGDPEHDLGLAEQIMHPGVVLIPVKDGRDTLVGYRIAIGPRVKDFGSMPLSKLQELAKTNKSPDLAKAIATKKLWESISSQPMP
jgi:hypothetical protein